MGISGYNYAGKLKNAANDAQAISDKLSEIGFEVSLLLNPDRNSINNALKTFTFSAETADIALIYFAGHGIEASGGNYLLPVDANIATLDDVQRVALPAARLLGATAGARRLRIVMLDSCRNNPFAGVDGVSNFALSSSSDGDATDTRSAFSARSTLVVYSAKDGSTALDGTGSNSPFAVAVLDNIGRPGIEIGMLFRQVRDAVMSATGNAQEPYTYGSISGAPIYLAGEGEMAGADVDLADKRKAWSALKPDAESQLVALAERGDTRSLVGLAYMRQNPGSSRYDPTQAVIFLQKAAALHDPEAEYELGKALELGIGIRQDPALAATWYRKAADQNFADAMNDLGYLYYQGSTGTPRDPAVAIDYFQRAADLGHPQAMFNFAALIDDNLVQGRGSEEAARYLYLAIRAGSADVLDQVSDNPLMFTEPTRRALQRLLSENGFYDSGIDGRFGSGTRRGLRKAYGLTD